MTGNRYPGRTDRVGTLRAARKRRPGAPNTLDPGDLLPAPARRVQGSINLKSRRGDGSRQPHAVGLREATFWSVFYIGVAVAFGLALWMLAGSTAGTEYFAGWVVEKSLSVDNLFVFVIIMTQFAVPPAYQQKVLLFGIAAALVMRAVFIALSRGRRR